MRNAGSWFLSRPSYCLYDSRQRPQDELTLRGWTFPTAYMAVGRITKSRDCPDRHNFTIWLTQRNTICVLLGSDVSVISALARNAGFSREGQPVPSLPSVTEMPELDEYVIWT